MNAQFKFTPGDLVTTPKGLAEVTVQLGRSKVEVKRFNQNGHTEFFAFDVDEVEPAAQLVTGTVVATKISTGDLPLPAPTERKGNYMRTSTGKRYYPMDPRPDEVDIQDIAHHLGNKCRYAGATRHFYSVAEHSVYVALDLAMQGASLELVMTGLLHDGSEAYNGDLIRPLKYDPAFSAPFKHVEELNEKVIAERFTLPYPWHPDVKKSDEAVTAAELRQIMNRVPEDQLAWADDKMHDDSRVAPFTIACLSPNHAWHLFLALWDMLDSGECPRTVTKIAELLNRAQW